MLLDARVSVAQHLLASMISLYRFACGVCICRFHELIAFSLLQGDTRMCIIWQTDLVCKTGPDFMITIVVATFDLFKLCRSVLPQLYNEISYFSWYSKFCQIWTYWTVMQLDLAKYSVSAAKLPTHSVTDFLVRNIFNITWLAAFCTPWCRVWPIHSAC